MTEARAESLSRGQPPHWAATASALLGLGALYLNGRGYGGLIVVAALLLLMYPLRLRLSRNALVIWPIRILAFAVIIVSSGRRFGVGDSGFLRGAWFLEPDYVNLFGYLCAGELVIQCWQQRKGSPRGEMMILSALIFAVATNTFDSSLMQYLAPAYVLLMALSFREYLPPRPAAAGGARHAWGPATTRLAAFALAGALGLGAVAVLNRYGQAIASWTLLPKPRLQITGISLSPTLGESVDVAPSTVRVLRVHYGGGGPLHLRGMAFDTYSRGAWGPSFSDRDLRPVPVAVGRPPAGGALASLLRIEQLRSDIPILYAPLETLCVLRPPVIRLQWDASHGRSIFYSLDDAPGLVCELLVGSAGTQGPLCAPPDANQRQRLLQLPSPLHPQVLSIARHLGRKQPPQTAQAIAAYLAANHGYSLQVRPGPDGDPLADFLINRRDAHCQYFASAAVILLRCNGVPARYVNGFYVHERESDGAYIVRQRDAHAWVEYWVDGTGWLTLDPTPESGRPDQAFEPVGVAQRISEWFSDLPDRIVAWIKRQGRRQAALAGVVAALAVAAIGGWRLLRRRRGATVVRSINYGFPSEELEQLARRFDRLLSKWGAACAVNRTWREHLSDASAAHLPRPLVRHAASLRQFLIDYDRIRFGPPDRPELVRRLREILERLERGHRSEENA